MQLTQWAGPGLAQTVFTLAPPPWHATPVGQWHAKRNRPALPTSKAALYYWRNTFRSWPFTTEGVLHPTDRMCLPMLRPITLSRAAKRPLAASLLATLALGHRRCLIVSRSFAGLRTTLKFNARQIPGTPFRRYTYHSQFIRHTCALVDIECHGSPSVAKHASMSNSETSPARGSAGSLRTFKNKSTVDTAAALLKGNFTRLRRHRADIYKY